MTLADIFAARQAIEGIVTRTPLISSPHLTSVAGKEFLLKLEITQPIGAFKLRGAVNAVSNLPRHVEGVTCCSTGNHGRGIAYAAKQRGVRAVVCMSTLVPQNKIESIKALGAEVRIIGNSQDEALLESQRLCETDSLVEISPFDDPFIISGQGTIGLEILEDRPDIDMILVPLSGGGLAGGVALAAKSINPHVKVIGISMDRGAAMHASLQAGHPVEVEEVSSLADSLGGGIGSHNKLSFQLCQTYLDDVVLVTEEEIYHAMQTLYYEDHIIAEGASVVGIAAMQTGKLPPPRGVVATIITSRNVDMGIFTRIVAGENITLGNYTIKGQTYGK